MTRGMIPLSRPSLDERESRAVLQVLESGWLAEGPANAEFEKAMAAYLGVREAVSLNSCTSALFLALLAHEVRGEVILPSFTFVATANAVVTAGARPVFADVEPDTLNLDPKAVERKITARTRAIIPVHFGGQSCDMDPLLALARERGLLVIEDSAETLGGTYRGKMAGTFATGCFSFFPTKNITTGEGGLLTTDDRDLAARVRTLAGHGIPRPAHQREKSDRPWHRSAVVPGYNFRMSSIHAAIGVAQAGKIEELNSLRRRHARRLDQLLGGVDELVLPVERPECRHVYQMYTVRLRQIDRDRFLRRLRAKGIGASAHFDPPVHLQDYYRRVGHGVLKLPVTEEASRTIVTLPMYPQLEEEEVDRIAAAVKESIAEERQAAGMSDVGSRKSELVRI